MQLQGMQAIAFLLVATGNFLDTGNRPALVFQVLVQLPGVGALPGLPSKGSRHRRVWQGEGFACALPACSCRPFGVEPCGVSAWCL